MMNMGSDMQEFVQQMQSMSSTQPGMMAPFGPMMPGFMPGMMPFPPMPNAFGMPGMVGMDNMAAMGGFGGGMQNGGWPVQQPGWGGGNGGEMQNGGGNGGAYFRAPINQHRHQQGRQTRLHPRAVDYKQLGS